MIKSTKLIDAFKEIPRENFVLEEMVSRAYEDVPLEIGYGQTISQPSTVMIMIDALELEQTDKVLEIGSGSGYCAAIMSKLAEKIYTIEIIPELVMFAQKNLRKSNIRNVEVILTDGSAGYHKNAPYDRIMVTAACPGIPAELINQLKDGGIIIAPVTYIQPLNQRMYKIIKEAHRIISYDLGEFRFVPLRGKYGYKE
jgi:protein-L-isoaspartate(D-aspartate) O-methyltransferase